MFCTCLGQWHSKFFHAVCFGPSRDLYGTPPLSAQKGPFGPSREIRMPERPDLNPIATDWSDWVDLMVSTHFDLVLGICLEFWGPLAPVFKDINTPMGSTIANISSS